MQRALAARRSGWRGSTCGEENDDRQRVSCQVLLVLEVLVRCDQDLELGSLSSGDEIAVQQGGPTTLVGRFNGVSDQGHAQQQYKSTTRTSL